MPPTLSFFWGDTAALPPLGRRHGRARLRGISVEFSRTRASTLTCKALAPWRAGFFRVQDRKAIS